MVSKRLPLPYPPIKTHFLPHCIQLVAALCETCLMISESPSVLRPVKGIARKAWPQKNSCKMSRGGSPRVATLFCDSGFSHQPEFGESSLALRKRWLSVSDKSTSGDEDTGKDSPDFWGCKCDSGRRALHILLTCGKITVAETKASNWLEGAQSDGI